MFVFPVLVGLSRPVHLAMVALTYMLGASIARYLGKPIDAAVLIPGLIGVGLAQAAMSLLAAVFVPNSDPLMKNETPAQRSQIRNAALATSVGALAAAAVIAIAISTRDGISVPALTCMGISLLVVVAFGVPPVRANDRGFGELLLAVQIGYLAPCIGFLLHAGTFHRLLVICITAITMLLLATIIVLELPSYGDDIQHGRTTVLTRLGWGNALLAHQFLVVAGYLLLAMAGLFGFSFELFLPAFLSIPFAVLQALLLRNIARGAKPVWHLLTVNGIAMFGLATYFLTVSFWLR